MNTTQTDTPETDAELERSLRACHSYSCGPDFARKLERARDTALRELAEAKKEIQILSKDKERLDWLDKNPNDVFSNKDGEYSIGYIANYSQNIRQAIDSAKQTQ